MLEKIYFLCPVIHKQNMVKLFIQIEEENQMFINGGLYV